MDSNRSECRFAGNVGARRISARFSIFCGSAAALSHLGCFAFGDFFGVAQGAQCFVPRVVLRRVDRCRTPCHR